MDGNSALTDVPERIPDGEYRLFVEDVFADAWGDEFTRTAAVEFHPPEPGAGSTYTTLLAFSELADDAAPGAAYRVQVTDGSLARVVQDPEASIERVAPTVPASEFVVPLVWTGDWAGSVGLAPHLLRFARNHSLLITGEPGAGKTEFIKLLLPQIRANPDEPVVVFDYKGEYRTWAERRGDVLRISTRDSTAHWNVFREARDEREFEQIGRALFRERTERAAKPYFPIAARQVLVTTMKFLAREGDRVGLDPDNAELTDVFDQYGPEELYRLVAAAGQDADGDGSPGYEDLQGAIHHLNPNAPKQTGGVYSTLQTVVRDVFTGDFARPNGRFSVRQYVAEPRGRVLLLDYPIREGDRVTAPFRYLIERAIELGLEDPGRQAYFVLDEFARIPHVEKLETLVATGRSRQVQGLFGLQSLSQMTATYGQRATESMLSGMTQEVFLRSGDPATTDYVRSRLGGERTLSRSVSTRRGPAGVDTTVAAPSMQETLQQFAPGEGVLLTRGGYVHAQVPMWSQLRERTRRAIRDRDPVWS